MFEKFQSDAKSTILHTIIAASLSTLLFLYHVDQGRIGQVKVSGYTMGTSYHVTLLGVKRDISKISWQKKIDDELIRINKIMSTYDEQSELSILNRTKKTANRISPELSRVILEAKKIARQSDGYYDVTVLPLVELWGFGKKLMHPELNKVADDPVRYRQLLQKLNISVGDQKFSITGETLIKHDVNIEIDLSSIAKGYGVDQIAKLLSEHKIENYLVEIGGEVVAQGRNLQGQFWRIGIETPLEEEQKQKTKTAVMKIVNLNNQAMATSGDYRNFKKIGAAKYGHTISPHSLMPTPNDLASVTVIAENCMLADAWATALKSMGFSNAQRLVEKLKIAAYFIVANPHVTAEEDLKFTEFSSSSFLKNIKVTNH